MSSTTVIDPFATKDLLDLPQLDDDTSQSWSGFRLDKSLQTGLFILAESEQLVLSKFQPEVLKLAIEDAPLLDLTSATQSSATESTTGHEEKQDQDITKEEVEDCWAVSDVKTIKHVNKLISWDHFVEPGYEEATQTFITEAGPVAFDLLLRKFVSKSHNDQTRYVKPDILVDALFDLGLGRSSVIFLWSESGQRFTETVQNYTTSGLSKDSLRHLIVHYLDAGARFRRLCRFGRSRTDRSPTKIALQRSMLSILHVVEEVIEISRPETRSLIQLQDVYHRPFVLSALLDRLLQNIASISDDRDLVTAVLAFAEQVAMEQPYFEHLMSTVVCRVLQPSLKHAEASIGFVLDGSDVEAHRKDTISVVLPRSTSKIYIEAKITLQALQEKAPDSLILQQRSFEHEPLSIEYSLNAMVPVQQRAGDYEQTLRELLVNQVDIVHAVRIGMADAKDLPNLDADTIDPFCFNANIFETVTEQTTVYRPNDDSVRHLTRVALTSDQSRPQELLVPCREAIDLSLNPFITAQHRLLSYSVLQILFQRHDLLSHINLLNRFQLLNDGTFVSKVSTALFDSGQSSGESKRRPSAKTGLRLQNRKTWPPASSELRLALTGVLSECMSDISDPTLTDTISFAIRDLSDEDLERCRDIDSIYALDFLRLSYRSPPASIIEDILTPSSLGKYDTIFNHLLRLLRMETLTRSLVMRHHHRHHHYRRRHNISNNSTSTPPSITQRFAIESHNLITSLASHSQLNVIQPIYSRLTTHLNKISLSLTKRDYDTTLTLTRGLEDLRRLHEHTLDKILKGLFLSLSSTAENQQSELRGIVERLFEVILRFAAEIPFTFTNDVEEEEREDENVRSKREKKIIRLHSDFKIHVGKLLELVRVEVTLDGNGSGSGGGGGKGKGNKTERDKDRDADGGDCENGEDDLRYDLLSERLLLVVDFSGFWSKS